MNGKQLKNSILQWAIQGKLVPQDPNDEPASVLLERIRTEKERLIKEKKIKRSKNESIIYCGEDNSYYEKFTDGTVKCIDDEVPFEIPVGWEWCRLKDICSMHAGKNISANKIHSDISKSNTYKCVGGNGLRGYTDSYNISGHYPIIGRQGALCGCLNIEDGNFYATEHAIIVDSYNIISPLFMYYFLKALNLNQYATATAQPGLAVSKIIDTLCPLPPLAEHHRIVDTIEKILPLVEIYNKAQGCLNQLNANIKNSIRKSIIQEAIQGKLVPQDLNDESASVLLERIRAEKERLIKEKKLKRDKNESVIFKGDDNSYYENIGLQEATLNCEFNYPNSWLIMHLRNVCQLIDGEKTIGSYMCMDAKFLRGISEGTYLNKGRFVYKDDNIMLVDGENSGEVFSAPIDGYMGSTFKQLWISSEMYKPYVLLFIQYFKDKLRNSKRGAAIPHLNKDIFYNLTIGIPPIVEQKRIVSRIDELLQLLQ